jgi:hypothetical protein
MRVHTAIMIVMNYNNNGSEDYEYECSYS